MIRIALIPAVVLLLSLLAQDASACTACFGRSDSEMAQGMNWGIYTLLAFVALILGCVTAFFVTIGRRAAGVAQNSDTPKNA